MQRILSAIAGLAMMLGAATAQAATVECTALTVTASNAGPYQGVTGTGGVCWDREIDLGTYAVLSRVAGDDVTAVDPAVGLYFEVGPYTFTEADAWSPPVFTFLDGILTSISYIVTDSSTPVDLAALGVNLFSFDIFRRPDQSPAVNFDGKTYSVNALVKYAVAPVPLPAGLPLLAGGLALLAVLRRRKPA